jgi:hypothetical protein
MALMQPYFFPYIGYYQLLAYSDIFYIYDDTHYSKGGWYTRNRVLHNVKTYEYINVSVERPRLNEMLNNVRLKKKHDDLVSILGKLTIYKKRAPYYQRVVEIVRNVFADSSETLVSINVTSLTAVSEYVGIEYFIGYSSTLNYDRNCSAEDKVIEINREIGSTEYINLPGGRDLYHKTRFESAGINLIFMDLPHFEYETHPFQYIPNLSMVDVLMWNSPEDIRKYINDHRV